MDSTGDFKAKTLMELRKIHLRTFVFELYTAANGFAQRKADAVE